MPFPNLALSSSADARSKGEQSGELGGGGGGGRFGFINNFAAAGSRLSANQAINEPENPFGRLGNYILILVVGMIAFLAFRKMRS
jgi:hypothetical protein